MVVVVLHVRCWHRCTLTVSGAVQSRCVKSWLLLLSTFVACWWMGVCHAVSCLVVMLSDRYARYLPPTQLCLFSFLLLVFARLVSLPPPLHTRTRNPRPPSLRLFYVVGLSHRCCCWLSRGQFRHFALRPSRNG